VFLAERLAQAVIDAGSGLEIYPSYVTDQDGARLVGWTVSVGIGNDPSYMWFTKESRYLEHACQSAIDEIAKRNEEAKNAG